VVKQIIKYTPSFHKEGNGMEHSKLSGTENSIWKMVKKSLKNPHISGVWELWGKV